MNAEYPIVLFDGVCNLCNRSVQFIIKRDKKKKFRFGSLQGHFGQQAQARFHLPADDFNSFLLLEGDKLYTRSTAALRVLKQLGRGWQLFYGLILLPKFIRDPVYKWIARNRYKWFGKMEACMIPDEASRYRFLE
ncbi:MAG: DCC1-like thiol-disulfide oxidoreductase family protein [Chitinophagaceae bacterium]